MKVDVTSVGSFQRKLTVVVPATQVRQQLDRAYKTLARQVNMPGFRQGKAPRRVLEARYGERVEADVAQDLIQTSWIDIMNKEALQPVSQPSVAESGEVGDSEGFKFTITVDVRPEIELQTWTGLDVPYPKVEISEEAVDAAVKARLEGHARLEEVTDRPCAQGDMALVELHLFDGEEEVATEQGTMIRTEGDPYYPGLEGLLIGTETGGTLEGEVTIGEDSRVEAVAGRTLRVNATLLSLQSYGVPELTDELAEELGYEGGAEGMRVALRQQMLDTREESARNQARANLLEVLINANRFDVPDGMIDQSLNMLMDELRLQQAYQSGRDPKSISFTNAQVADLRMRAAFAAKASLILEWVSRKEKIEVEESDLESRYQELADTRGQTVEAVRGWFQKESAVEELKERILEEKTLDWLLEQANLIDPPTPAEPAEAAAEPAEAAAEPAEA
ncbi:MAG TPA: trigger factor, partial [Deltaproteobacteria bacterium]|nr:trigger factor [Deltaproteobacteria bacterium]